jgi:hypothetical protein
MNTTQKSYPSDVTEAECELLLPNLSLMSEDAPQREYPLRDLFNAVRYVVRTGCQWRFLPQGSSALDCGLPTSSPLDASGCLRAGRARLAGDRSISRRAEPGADGDNF